VIDEREILRRAAETLTPPEPSFDRLMHRRDRVQRNRRVRAGVLGIAVAIAVGWWAVDAIRNAPIPADHDRSEELGIFAPVAGRIAYVNEGTDLGYGRGVWAVDPSAPSDTTAGPRVADDIVANVVRLGPKDGIPLGWSSDGTELLFKRGSDDLFPEEYLYVLHSDGSETRLNKDPMYFAGATISPDGTRVVFAAQADHAGLYVVDADGGQPTPLPLPILEGIVADPTFSPDGTQIAYVDSGDAGNDVWVSDADGTDAREVLANEDILAAGAGSLQWSPAGDRIAIDVRSPDPRSPDLEGTDSIFTFAPDGSAFTQVYRGAISPYWSPDGSRIAFTIPCGEQPDRRCPEGSIRRDAYDRQPGDLPAGLAIADADGSNVRAFGFAASGPWHPGASFQSDEAMPTPVDTFARVDGEVLSFTGGSTGEPGDLVAVKPDTGEERVLVRDLDAVNAAQWSGDGRWVAYEVPRADGVELWVVGASLEPRRVATGASILTWSRAGATLATIRLTSSLDTDIAGSTLSTIDPVTGAEAHVGVISEGVGDVTSAPAWSPDLSRVVFGARGGAIYSIDARSGARSLLVRLPGEQLDSVDQIAWSPNGTHIAVAIDAGVGGGLLYVMDNDGSHLRVLLDDYPASSVAWSPDGTRLAYRDQSGTIWVAPMDGSDPTEVGAPLPASGGDTLLSDSDLVWSPDGSRIGFREIRSLTDGGRAVDVSAVDAHGAGAAEPIDEITFASWAGGSYDCGCV
jgi:Tol biopolymer transport system component